MFVATFATIITVVLYLISAYLLVKKVGEQNKTSNRFIFGCLFGAVGVHFFLLADSTILASQNQMSLTNIASLFSWLIAVTMMFAHAYIRNIVFLPVVCVFALICVSLNQWIPTSTSIGLALSTSLVIHITLSLLAYGCVTIAMLYAFQLNYINAKLKHKQKSILTASLPPLMAVERILFKLLLVGTVLLGIALASGLLFNEHMLDKQHAHKTVLSSVAFIIFIATLLAEKWIGLTRRSTVLLTCVGVGVLTLGYFGSRIVREIIL